MLNSPGIVAVSPETKYCSGQKAGCDTEEELKSNRWDELCLVLQKFVVAILTHCPMKSNRGKFKTTRLPNVFLSLLVQIQLKLLDPCQCIYEPDESIEKLLHN